MLARCEPVLTFVKKADYQFYQNLVEVLIPDVLRPIPGTLTQAIRNFAKGLEGWLLAAMKGCPDDMILVKVSPSLIISTCWSILVTIFLKFINRLRQSTLSRRRSGATLLWTTWLKQHVQFFTTLHKSLKCFLTWTVLTSTMSRSRYFYQINFFQYRELN